MRILLVEDDELAARAIEWALRELGVQVDVLSAGRDVIRTLARMKPDAVVLDIILNDADGVTLCREIRETWPELPVVLASGRDSDFPGVREALTDQRTAFLQKPFDMKTLLMTLKKLMR